MPNYAVFHRRDPKYFRSRFYDEEEFSVGFLVPNYAGFLQLMDKFFVEGLKKQYQRNKEEEEKEG